MAGVRTSQPAAAGGTGSTSTTPAIDTADVDYSGGAGSDVRERQIVQLGGATSNQVSAVLNVLPSTTDYGQVVRLVPGQDIGYTTDIAGHKIGLGEFRIAGFDISTNGTTATTGYVSIQNTNAAGGKNVYVVKYDLFCSVGFAKINYLENFSSDSNPVQTPLNPIIGQSGSSGALVKAGTTAPTGGTALSAKSMASANYPLMIQSLFVIAPTASVSIQTTPNNGTGAELVGNIYWYEE